MTRGVIESEVSFISGESCKIVSNALSQTINRKIPVRVLGPGPSSRGWVCSWGTGRFGKVSG